MKILPTTRRALCGGGLSLLAASGARAAATFCQDGGVPPEPAVVADPPLGRINSRVAWGAALSSPATYDTRLVAALEAEKPNLVAIASGLKFGHMFPKPPAEPGALAAPHWWETDDVLAVAARLGAAVRGDAMAWNDYLPEWVAALARDRPAGWQDTLAQAFEHQFAVAFAHLSARRDVTLPWCGVVNEPFQPWTQEGGVPSWRTGAWLDAFGTAPDGVPAYIHRAFELGERHRAPGTALYLNEAWCEGDRFGPTVRPAMLRLVDALQKAGRKVDGVGLQAHLIPQWMNSRREPDWGPFVSFLRDLERRGVAIYITELDVNDCSVRDRALRDRLVASYTESFVRACLDVPAVTQITNWDLSDGYAWLAETTTPASTFHTLPKWASCVPDPPCPRPALYDGAMRPKTARDGMARALDHDEFRSNRSKFIKRDRSE